MSEADLYALLGIEAGADEVEIQRAFRRLAMATHPDRNLSPGSTERMCALLEARNILIAQISKKKRVSFDAFAARIVRPTFGEGDHREFAQKLARMINKDTEAKIHVTGIGCSP
jgi:DnaJ-class molecular chaperone